LKLIDHVVCPLCQSDLQVSGATISCSQCDYQSFFINDIPWLFENPKTVAIDWTNRFNAHLQNLQNRYSTCQASLNDRSLMKLTRQRLQSLTEALQFQIKAINDLLQPLGVRSQPSSAVNDLTNSVLSAKQQAQTYGNNVFRDWAWSSQENKVHADLVGRSLTVRPDLNMAVLGSGAGRLTADLHNLWKCKKTVAVDINPLLTFISQKMTNGDSLDLIEFPASPLDSDHISVQQTLRAETKTEGIDHLFADAAAPPLADQSMDLVVTPWFLDILPQDADYVIREINRILKERGHWIYFGPYFFDSAKETLAYSKEELLHLVQKDGFEIKNQDTCEIPYLQSPSSCQKRFETVLCFSARKIQDVDVFVEEVFRPPWLMDPSLAIPQNQDYARYAFINQLHLDILNSIDGQTSLNDLALRIHKQYRLPVDEALGSMRTFFATQIERGLFKY
jgi:ubiquinone/menaquinone biosynthesis C-methylase UbiE